jgi:hypothetical protein
MTIEQGGNAVDRLNLVNTASVPIVNLAVCNFHEINRISHMQPNVGLELGLWP